jgi:hypothetical protein
LIFVKPANFFVKTAECATDETYEPKPKFTAETPTEAIAPADSTDETVAGPYGYSG